MNQRSGNGRIAGGLALAAAAVGPWIALTVLFAAPLALTSQVSWGQALRFGSSFWALWLLFLPIVAWFSFRFPIERRHLFRNLTVHLLACLLVVIATRTAPRLLPRIAPVLQRPESPEAPTAVRPPRMGAPGAYGVLVGLRAALDVLVYGSVLGVCQAIRQFQRSQERERRAAELESSLASAKLQALRMQINPHFLFNTLNSIAALVYVNPRAADEMLGDLSELLRRSLDSMKEQEVPLAQELEFVRTYLSIEQKRFGDRLQLEVSVPEEFQKTLVPALVLQPLVENAIRHGIEPRRGPGLISIRADRAGNQLQLVIQDNGRGGAQDTSTNKVGRGIGLDNTRARLRGLYGADQSFSFGDARPHGCRVEIRLPLHDSPRSVRVEPSTQPDA